MLKLVWKRHAYSSSMTFNVKAATSDERALKIGITMGINGLKVALRLRFWGFCQGGMRNRHLGNVKHGRTTVLFSSQVLTLTSLIRFIDDSFFERKSIREM